MQNQTSEERFILLLHVVGAAALALALAGTTRAARSEVGSRTGADNA